MSAAAKKAIADVVATHDVIVCAGSGGVGKTTTAAAIGLLGAARGRNTIVLTIDPAKRLADSLGIKELGNEPTPVRGGEGGKLSAMMLDQKGAWDALVERYADSEETRQRIFHNAFYQNLSGTFAGSQEYMAIEQLSQLHDGGEYDLIVVDTPPTHHALDFLDAPKRLGDFLNRRVMRWFVRPYMSAGWSGLRLVNKTASALLRRLEDATGVSALAEVSEFFGAMSDLFEGWEGRVKRVERLLRSKRSAFILVATPEEQVLSEAEYFCSKVEEHDIQLRGVVFNRVQNELAADLGAPDQDEIDKVLKRAITSAPIRRRLFENFLRYEVQARGDQLRIENFRSQLPASVPVATVPNFEEDLHDIKGLRRLHEYLESAG
jgi:anion-transporting  ArsA/GET3 family ATPase